MYQNLTAYFHWYLNPIWEGGVYMHSYTQWHKLMLLKLFYVQYNTVTEKKNEENENDDGPRTLHSADATTAAAPCSFPFCSSVSPPWNSTYSHHRKDKKIKWSCFCVKKLSGFVGLPRPLGPLLSSLVRQWLWCHPSYRLQLQIWAPMSLLILLLYIKSMSSYKELMHAC